MTSEILCGRLSSSTVLVRQLQHFRGMRTAFRIIGRTITRETSSQEGQFSHLDQFVRRLSTNSAINRGIRRGKSSGFGGSGRLQINRRDRPRGDNSILRSDGGLQIIDRGDKPRWERGIPRIETHSRIDRGYRSRGDSSIAGRDGRSQIDRGDRSGLRSSIPKEEDGRSPESYGARWRGQRSAFKRDYRGDGGPGSKAGIDSITQNHAGPPPRTPQDDRSIDRSDGSSYQGKEDQTKVLPTNRWMGRGRVSNRKRNATWWTQAFPSSTDGKDVDPLRPRRAFGSPQHLEMDEGGEEGGEDMSRVDLSSRKPVLSKPYTTPASKFLYGTSVVMAALKSKRRKFYKLYIHDGLNGNDGQAGRDAPDPLAINRRLALAAGVEVVQVKSDSLPLLDKMSDGRPHNVRP